MKLTSTNAGSYYDYLKSTIEESLNNFLSDTTFPWTKVPQKEFPRGDPGIDFPPIRRRNLDEPDGSITYNTVQEYINSLNSDTNWVTYDSKTNKATITNVGDFVKKCKNPSKDVGAFDDLNRAQGENQVFGTNYDSDNNKKHFDQIMNDLLNTNSYKYTGKSDFKYNYPSKYDLPFLPIECLGPIFFKLLTPELIINLIYKILSEQSIIFMSDELENLTALV